VKIKSELTTQTVKTIFLSAVFRQLDTILHSMSMCHKMCLCIPKFLPSLIHCTYPVCRVA